MGPWPWGWAEREHTVPNLAVGLNKKYLGCFGARIPVLGEYWAPGGLGALEKRKMASQLWEAEQAVLETEGAWHVWGQRSWMPGHLVQRILDPESQALKRSFKASN